MISKNVTHILVDFDGVLTDNYVYLNEEGQESVRCSRSDGLAFSVLKKLKYEIYIYSTEKNQVVTARAKKLKIDVFQGIENKKEFLQKLVADNRWNLNNILYIGNDLNDKAAMELCGYSACPIDSDDEIKKIATHILSEKGGKGVMRGVLKILDIKLADYF